MNQTTSWIVLIFAGILEICWVIGLRYSAGFTKIIPSLFTIFTLGGSMYLLGRASENLPMGTAYSVWVGIGSLGATLYGILFFKESASLMKLFFLVLLLISIVGLKVSGNKQVIKADSQKVN